MLKPAFIDVSHWNTAVPTSLKTLAEAGIVGVVHKLTESTSFVDDECEESFHLVQDADLCWGLYHFIRPGNIAAQVDHFIGSATHVSDDDTLWCLDWEDSLVSIDDALTFLKGVQNITGHSPVLYSGHVLKEALGGQPNEEITRYRLWLAQYADAPELPPGYDKFWGWQYTDKGELPGTIIVPPVDLNAFDGTALQLRASWSGRPFDEGV